MHFELSTEADIYLPDWEQHFIQHWLINDKFTLKSASAWQHICILVKRTYLSIIHYTFLPYFIIISAWSYSQTNCKKTYVDFGIWRQRHQREPEDNHKPPSAPEWKRLVDNEQSQSYSSPTDNKHNEDNEEPTQTEGNGLQL